MQAEILDMKRIKIILFPLLVATMLFGTQGCLKISSADPFSGNINKLSVTAVYPAGYTSFARADVKVTVENMNSGDSYVALTNASGVATISLPNGIYRVSMSDRDGQDIFNGTSEKIHVDGADVSLNLSLAHSKAGTLVIKELYCGGCSKAPYEGTYQSDQYVIIHNNDSEPIYLDSLCVGTLSPYNSTSTNPWITTNPTTGEKVYKNFVPIVQAVWSIGGTGKTFPLASGADAVICLRGAIDHTLQYPLSVNLNNSSYFVCYNTNYFPNTVYHPVPGDQIQQDHILEVVIKTGLGNAFTVSLTSPAFVIFKAKGTTIKQFVTVPDNVIPVPGSSVDNVVAVPLDWVIDGVEVFDGRSSANAKRLVTSIDAGYVTQTDIYQGHTLFRNTDETATAEKGYEVLQDTNNSTKDFYERKTQSLHK